MLRRSLVLGVLISLNCLVFGDAPTTAEGILKDLGISKGQAVAIGLWNRIGPILKTREGFRKQYRHCDHRYIVNGRVVREEWSYKEADEKWADEYYGNILPNLTIQVTLASIQRQLKEQSEKMDKLVAGNAQFIRFLVLMDSAITSERDIRARVEAAKQLLESDLVDEQQKVLLLNNKIKELKEKAETVAVENAELRAQMQAELEAIQVQLKERMLSMM